MNRRQVLFGAGATALAFSGFVPFPSSAAPVSMSVTFAPFTQGVRGTYTLSGTATLVGTIPPIAPGPSSSSLPALATQGSTLPEPAAFAPVQQTAAPAAAPARAPMMSIVPVQRGATRAARFVD